MQIDTVFHVLHSGPGGDPPFRLIIADAKGHQRFPLDGVECPPKVQAAAAWLLKAAGGPAEFGWGWYCPEGGERTPHDAIEDTGIVADWLEKLP